MILITGGAGLIGSALVYELNQAGREDIIIVDRLGDADKWRNLRKLKYSDYIHADELFLPEYEWALDSIEMIFHMGACSSTTERDVDYLMKNNVEYSKEIWRVATELEVPLIYASSAATYGAGEQGYDDHHGKSKNLLPLNPYGYSKQVFDEWVLKQEQRPLYWYGLKFFNVFGPNEYHKEDMRSLVHKAFEQIKETGKVRLFKSHRDDYDDGKQLRDFVYVKDIVKAMVLMSEKSDGSGIYNMGTAKARSFYDLVVSVFKALEEDVNIEYIDMPERLRSQYQYFTEAKMTKFRELCPDFKFRDLEEAVSDYVLAHLNTEDPYF